MLFLDNVLGRFTSGLVYDSHAFGVLGLRIGDAETIIDALKKGLVIGRIKRVDKHVSSFVEKNLRFKNKKVLDDRLEECDRLTGPVLRF